MTTSETTLEFFDKFAGTTPCLWAMRIQLFAKDHEEALAWQRKS